MKKRFFVIFILQRILYGVVFLMFTLRWEENERLNLHLIN
jgi:hypothetical protein